MKKKQKIIILILIGIIIILGSVFLYQGLQVTQNKADYFELKDGWHIEINDTVYENMSLGDFLFPSVDKGDEIRMRCTLLQNCSKCHFSRPTRGPRFLSSLQFYQYCPSKAP